MSSPITFDNPAPRPSRLRPLLLAAAALALAACPVPAANAEPPAVAPANNAAEYQLPENTADLLRLDDTMRAYFAARVRPKAAIDTMLDEIVAAILSENGLHFRYEYDGIYDVREAFRRRRGNCVTFSMLVVAVAREYKIRASFNEVALISRWARTGDIVLEHRHINVWVPNTDGGYEIDLKMLADQKSQRSGNRTISDARAFAALYSNAGVFRLTKGDRAGALPLLTKATCIDPRSSTAWVNLANAHLIDGDSGAATACYEKALALNSSALSAISGMAWVKRHTGELAEAEKLERKAVRYRERNPYYLASIARIELADGRAEEARSHLARAIRIKDNEPEFFLLMVDVARSLGHEREARHWANRLNSLQRDTIAEAR